MGLHILSYGSYLPHNRIKKEEFIKTWGSFQGRITEKAVIGYDEDVTTMAVEAALNALVNSKLDSNKIGLISIGTSTAPYSMRSIASEVRMALGLLENIALFDFKESQKAGITALNGSMDFIINRKKAGIIIGSDAPKARANDEQDHAYGAGAGALVLGNEKGIATIEAITSSSIDFIADKFQKEGEEYVSNLNIVSYHRHAYQTTITNAIRDLLKETGLKIEDFKWVIIQGHDTREGQRATKLVSKDQITFDNINNIGDAGAASVILELINVLETKANPGDRILCVSYGSGIGADAFSVLVNEKLQPSPDSVSYTHYLNNKNYINYTQYLKFKEMIDLE